MLGSGAAVFIIAPAMLVGHGASLGGGFGVVLVAIGGAGLIAIGTYVTALSQVYRILPLRDRTGRQCWPV